MKCETWGMVEHTERAHCEAQAESVSIEVSEEEVDRHGGHGMSLGSIDVVRADGRRSRFWFGLYRTNRGQITARITANKTNNETSKTVTGVWLDYEARAKGES